MTPRGMVGIRSADARPQKGKDMTSKERVIKALAHEQPDRPPIDLGATSCSGIHAAALERLRAALGLAERPVYVYETLQQLGYVDFDVLNALQADVVGLLPYTEFVGVKNDVAHLKPYPIPHGGMGRCVSGFVYREKDGERYAFPQGDVSVPPSLRMPKDGYFFDNINRSPTTLDDYGDAKEEFAGTCSPISDEEAEFYKKQVDLLTQNTDYAIVSNCAVAAFGDAAILPGASLRQVRGVRTLDEWYMLHKLDPQYIRDVFDMQYAAAVASLEKLYQAVGDRIQAIFISGTDFGMQTGLMISKEDFQALYKPYYTKINRWIHGNTRWKAMYHCCGSVVPLLDDFVEMGVDILNPVQCSAAGMDPAFLKNTYGKQLAFWGGGIDTQRTLPFGTAEECRAQARERLRIFAPGGGYVFNTIHNIQGNTPIENVLAVYDEARRFSLG